jgi:hypothetical protein
MIVQLYNLTQLSLDREYRFFNSCSFHRRRSRFSQTGQIPFRNPYGTSIDVAFTASIVCSETILTTQSPVSLKFLNVPFSISGRTLAENPTTKIGGS